MNQGVTWETGLQEDNFRDLSKRQFAMFEFRYRTRGKSTTRPNQP